MTIIGKNGITKIQNSKANTDIIISTKYNTKNEQILLFGSFVLLRLFLLSAILISFLLVISFISLIPNDFVSVLYILFSSPRTKNTYENKTIANSAPILILNFLFNDSKSEVLSNLKNILQ